MRPIKFRAKSRHEDAWYYGGIFQTGADCFVVKRGNWEPYLICNIDHNTVGQFTGFYDCDGKEIYEGDILLVTSSKRMFTSVVMWDKKEAYYKLLYWGAENVLHQTPLFRWLNDTILEVTGNIHDNPEFMRGYNEYFQ